MPSLRTVAMAAHSPPPVSPQSSSSPSTASQVPDTGLCPVSYILSSECVKLRLGSLYSLWERDLGSSLCQTLLKYLPKVTTAPSR